MKIRKAKSNELKTLAVFMKQEFAKKPYFEKWTNKTALKKLKEYASYNDIYLAIIDKQIAGFIVSLKEFYYDAYKGFVHELVVSRDFQGKGVGKALMRYVERYYKKQGADVIYLLAVKKAPAYKFYKKLGYKEGETISMEKNLK